MTQRIAAALSHRRPGRRGRDGCDFSVGGRTTRSAVKARKKKKKKKKKKKARRRSAADRGRHLQRHDLERHPDVGDPERRPGVGHDDLLRDDRAAAGLGDDVPVSAYIDPITGDTIYADGAFNALTQAGDG